MPEQTGKNAPFWAPAQSTYDNPDLSPRFLEAILQYDEDGRENFVNWTPGRIKIKITSKNGNTSVRDFTNQRNVYYLEGNYSCEITTESDKPAN